MTPDAAERRARARIARRGSIIVSGTHELVQDADGSVRLDSQMERTHIPGEPDEADRDVLSLADALRAAEARAVAAEASATRRVNRGAVDRILSAWEVIAHAHRVDPSPANAERLATLATCAAQVRDEALAERDTARSALDGLTAAVREVEESEGALETMIDDSAWTLDDERIAEERVAAAHTALDALLSAAPAPTTVPAPLVRAYLAAEETMRLVAADDHRRDTYHEWAKRHGAAMDAVDAARTALEAALAAATTTPEESL